MMTIQQLAAETRKQFKQDKRDDGSVFWHREGADDWVQTMCFAAHGDMLPDDHRYAFIVEALDAIADYDNQDDARDSLEADIYTAELTDWLASNVNRAGYVDDAVIEYGSRDMGVIERIALGQLAEKWEVFDIVYRELIARLAALAIDQDNQDDEGEDQ